VDGVMGIMKKYFLTGLLLCVIWNYVSGQAMWDPRYNHPFKPYHEITFGLGANNFLGELGGANMIGSGKFSLRDFDVPAIRPVIHFGYRYQPHQNWAVRTDISAAFLGGNDKFTQELFRNNRNLNFRSPLIELSTRGEYIFNSFNFGHKYKLKKNIHGWKNIHVKYYLFAGVGLFWFDPYGKNPVTNKWIRLKPLTTEGQGLVSTRKKYSSVQFTIPLGLGLRYALTRYYDNKWWMGIEYGVRWTFTDYMDDASTTYFDNAALSTAQGSQGALALQMANPSPTANDPSNPMYNSTLAGQQRGDPRDKDTYMFATISIYYTPEKQKRKSFTYKRSHMKRHRIKKVPIQCPKF
jgi:hypothetical protein